MFAHKNRRNLANFTMWVLCAQIAFICFHISVSFDKSPVPNQFTFNMMSTILLVFNLHAIARVFLSTLSFYFIFPYFFVAASIFHVVVYFCRGYGYIRLFDQDQICRLTKI